MKKRHKMMLFFVLAGLVRAAAFEQLLWPVTLVTLVGCAEIGLLNGLV
jgi:hypothetical protein